LVMKE